VSELLVFLRGFFLVSFGATLGSFLRFNIVNLFQSRFHESFWGVFAANNIAIFFSAMIFGLFHRYHLDMQSNSFFLLASIGFLGSLSTFSSFIMELLQLLIDREWRTFFLRYNLSIFLGILIAFIGYKLAFV
tara:strand:+ start:896 stop:1291 length:396 start_codon:yes stop_codon:yes gene_type:complete